MKNAFAYCQEKTPQNKHSPFCLHDFVKEIMTFEKVTPTDENWL